MATIRITDLTLQAIIGTNDWEREVKQEVVINVTLEFNAAKATQSDNLKDTVDYKVLTKRIIQLVEHSQFFLIEKLADSILKLALDNKRVLSAAVRVDKPLALRFAKSVSIELKAQNK